MKKLTYKKFLEILKTNSKENPFNIDKYDKQSVIKCKRKLHKKIDFYIKSICDCGTVFTKNMNRSCKDFLNLLTKCRLCLAKETFVKKYGVDNPSKSLKIKKKKENTCLNNYGVKNPSQAKEVRDKKQKTCRERFGVNSPLESKDIQAKIKQTNLERYGVENISQNKEINNKRKETFINKYGVDNPFKSDEIKEKIIDTNIALYGVKNPFQSEEVKEKSKQTNLERYGTEYATQSDKIKEKVRKTNNNLYGKDYYVQTEDFKEKSKQTNLKKYNHEYYMQSETGKNKQIQTKIDKYGSAHISYYYQYDDLLFDSSWELAFYIYHLDKGHNIKIGSDIKNFSYECNNEIHYYFPDFKVNNKYYEIKGEQFIERYKNGNIKTLICPYDRTKDKIYNAKYRCMKKHNVTIIDKYKIKKYFSYVIKTYGESYLDQFKIKTDKNSDIE